MREHRIQVDTARCIGCGLCRQDCPSFNISIVGKKAAILTQDCIKCGHCVAICPKAAVSMTGFDESPIEIEEATTLNPQLLLKAIQTRRTIRQFKDHPIPTDVIHHIIQAGRFTPTAKNAQDVSYIVLTSGTEAMEACERIAVQTFRRLLPVARLVSSSAKHAVIDNHFFFKNAAAVLLVVAKEELNGGLAASNLELMAQANGLGVLYSGFFAAVANISPSLRRQLGLKHGEKVVTTLVLGYPNVTYHRTAQKETATVRFL